MSRRVLGLMAVGLLALALLILPRATSAHELCFPSDKTPHCLGDPFSDYWENNGGLPVFGYPITTAASEMNADTGQTYLTQWVERTRMEDHPENAGTPYRVLLGLLGKERLRQLGRDYALEPREAGARAGCLWFEQTGHNVCNIAGNLGFRQYWEGHGLTIPGLDAYARSLQLFGLPLTEPKMETNANGDTVLTQWFERARFEWHPANPDAYKVLLGLLGREVRDASPSIPPTIAPPPLTPIAPTATTVPGGLPPSYNNCQADPNAAQAPDYPVDITNVDKGAETVTIKNVSGATVALDGWRICSIRGNQLHATLSGSLAAGESRVIPSQASGLIWSNSDPDDGALYDAEGRLVSYWDE